MVDREKRVNVRVSDEELGMLNELAEHEGVSQSDYIRLFIRRTYAETFPSKRRKPKK